MPSRSSAALPADVAWIGAVSAPALVAGRTVAAYPESDGFLLSRHPHAHRLYLVEDGTDGIPALAVVALVRKRSRAPIVLLARDFMDVFVPAMEAGAQMVLPRPCPRAHLDAAVDALLRHGSRLDGSWVLRAEDALLISPAGASVPLSAADLAILAECARAAGAPVAHATLSGRLGHMAASPNNLHATVYRLRRRIEQCTGLPCPLHTVARVGYEFRAALVTG